MSAIKMNKNDVETFFNVSGAGMNRSRGSSVPSSPSRTVTFCPKVTAADTVTPLLIDLYNFEDPQYENSKYILTCPRSLEACSRLNIRPMELLYRPLIQYQEDYIPQGLSMRDIYDMFDQSEHERTNKLQMCREEEKHIIDEEKKTGIITAGPVVGVGEPGSTLTRKSSVREAVANEDDEDYETMDESDEGVVPSKRNGSLDRGSVQRKRTAWTSSAGHKRVTAEEIESRSQELQTEGQQLREAMLSASQKISAAARPSRRSNRKAGPPQKKQARLEKKALQENGQHHNGNNGFQGSQESVTDAVSVTSSRASRPWVRDPAAEAKPIANPRLRQKLSGAKGSGVKVTPRDQKILELMLAKREEEKQQAQKRDASRLHWEQERQKEANVRNSVANSRRRALSEERRRQESHRSDKVSSRRQDEERGSQQKQQAAEMCRRSWVQASQGQLQKKKSQLLEKKQREMERKKSVEKRLEEQREELEQYHVALRDSQDKAIQRAASMRMTKEQEQAFRTKWKNFQSKKRHEEKMEEINKLTQEEVSARRQGLQQKDKVVVDKVRSEQSRVSQQHRRKSLDVDRKLKDTRDKQQKMEEEITRWQDDLHSYRKKQEERAMTVAKQNVMQRSRKASDERRTKEQLQKLNMKKLLSAEEEWRADVEATIAMKDSRTKLMQREKDELVTESRSLAQTSQRLREELRQHYSMNDLDKLNQHAQLENKVIQKAALQSTTMTMSNLNLS